MERFGPGWCNRNMRRAVVAIVVAASVVGCTTQASAPRASPTSAEGQTVPVASFAAGRATTFEELRTRPIRSPAMPRSGCPITQPGTVRFADGTTRRANGTAPFYFGPWDGLGSSTGDWNKTPWRVEPGYAGRLIVRGWRIDGPGEVAFGFWPRGLGTPADQPGVPISFKRTDSEGRIIVYQPELDIDAPAGGRGDAHFWSFRPSDQPAWSLRGGCYAVQVDGDTFTHVTVIPVP